MLTAALEYIARGWSIFPLSEPNYEAGKHGTPRVRWADYQSRIPTVEEVAEWWTRWPTAGIAIITGRVSGIVVVDVDPRHGGTALGLPDTSCVAATGGGGSHHFYSYPEDVEVIHNQVNGDDCPDIQRRGRDVRADGGYVIAAPSMHHSRRKYAWASFGDVGTLSPAPKWSLEPIEEKNGTAKQSWLTELIDGGTRPGKRNDDLSRFAGYLASKSIPSDVGLALSRSWMDGQDEPLNADEIETTVKSVYRTEARRNPQRTIAPETARKLFKTLTLSQFMRKHSDSEVSWLVDEWLPSNTIGFVASPPGGFKTWLMLDLATSIASGRPFLGRYPVTNPGPVLMVQQEDNNAKTAERSALVMMSRLGMPAPKLIDGDLCDVPLVPTDKELPLYFHDERKLRVNDREMLAALKEFVKEVKPRMVVIDPFYSFVETEDFMARAAMDMACFKTWRDLYGTSFLFVHHTKKGANWGRENLWGSQFLNAFSETTYQIRRPEGEEFNVVQRYFKGEAVQEFVKCTFDIRVADYHYSADTELISKEEAERIVKQGPEKKGDGKVYVTGLPKQVLDTLAVLDEPISVKKLARHLEEPPDKVENALRRLCGKGDVVEDALGRWSHKIPSLS